MKIVNRTNCADCNCELTEDNKVWSGRVRKDGTKGYNSKCKGCYAIYQQNKRIPKTNPCDIVWNKPIAIERALKAQKNYLFKTVSLWESAA